LNDPQLEADHATAWAEWEAAGDFADWESTTGDGLVVGCGPAGIIVALAEQIGSPEG
jgi:hypothetical protein